MWPGFDGKGYSREQWLAHVAETPLMPTAAGVTLHATGIPTLAQALAMNPANYIANTQRYYENTLGWQHGPHAFADLGDGVSRPAIWGFSSLSVRGTHCSCDNGVTGPAFFGLEAMGNRNTEDYTTGPGALVLENQHFAAAALFVKMGKTPDYNTLRPHSRCAADGHTLCPHGNWEMLFRASETAAIVNFMNVIGKLTPNPTLAAQAVPLYPPTQKALYGTTAWVQSALNAWIDRTRTTGLARLLVDGDYGPATAATVRSYQRAHYLDADGLAGPKTCASLNLYT